MKHEVLSQHTMNLLRDVLNADKTRLDVAAEQRLQWICQEKIYALSDLEGEVAHIRAFVKSYKALPCPTQREIAERIETRYTEHLRHEINILKQWVEDLCGMPVSQQELERRTGFSGHFNPDVRFSGRPEEKFICSLSGMSKLLFGSGSKPNKPETYIRDILIQELQVFFEEDLGFAEYKPAMFAEFVKNLVTDPAMEKLDIENIQKVIERVNRSKGNLPSE